MSGYWHQWHWWYLPALLVWAWAQYRFVNWIVRPDGRWIWQKDPALRDVQGGAR